MNSYYFLSILPNNFPLSYSGCSISNIRFKGVETSSWLFGINWWAWYLFACLGTFPPFTWIRELSRHCQLEWRRQQNGRTYSILHSRRTGRWRTLPLTLFCQKNTLHTVIFQYWTDKTDRNSTLYHYNLLLTSLLLMQVHPSMIFHYQMFFQEDDKAT